MPGVDRERKDEARESLGNQNQSDVLGQEKESPLIWYAIAEAFFMLGGGYHEEVALNMARMKYDSQVPGITGFLKRLIVAFKLEEEDFGLSIP